MNFILISKPRWVIIVSIAIYTISLFLLGYMFGVKENIDNAVYNTISVAYQQEVVQNKVNINTATFEQLKMLPGVGEGKATDIINHRPYCDIFELLSYNIVGISTFKNIEEVITVD